MTLEEKVDRVCDLLANLAAQVAANNAQLRTIGEYLRQQEQLRVTILDADSDEVRPEDVELTDEVRKRWGGVGLSEWGMRKQEARHQTVKRRARRENPEDYA